MLLVSAVKFLVLGGCMLPIAFGVLGTGILFAGYNLSFQEILKKLKIYSILH